MKCYIDVTNRIYELQERLNEYGQITDKYIYEGAEPGKLRDFYKLILIFLLAKFLRTVLSFCTSKRSVTCKNYSIGIGPHFYTMVLLRMPVPQRIPQRTYKYL